MISRWSSPCPPMRTWPVSSSVLTRKDGSSSASFWSALESLSWSVLVFGSIAISMTGFGNSIRSRMIGASVVVMVSPVVVSLRPASATMSPVMHASTSSRELACIWSMRPTRCLASLVTLTTCDPVSSVPE